MAVPYLQIDNLTKSFGDLVLFENISFGIAEGQRVGLIAKNGSGKTTLLNIIAGKEGYDSGNIVFRRDLRVDYLEQDPQYPEELTVLEACFHHGNSTVELIKEYERCMETEGHPGLENLLARMDQEKAWEYEQPVPVRITTPVCFLTDRESLSFGETIMELIKHHQIGPIIGEPTSGTNGAAVILKSPSIGFLFTGYKFLNHDGSPHHGIGVLPDIPCRPRLEDIRRGEDTLLKEACQWITNSCNLSKQKQTEL